MLEITTMKHSPILLDVSEWNISALRKHLRLLREDSVKNNIPLRIIVDTERYDQNTDLFWSDTYIHSEIDDLLQMQCDDGIGSREIRIVANMDIPDNFISDIDYDAIYLEH